jgi:hypothetical protein
MKKIINLTDPAIVPHQSDELTELAEELNERHDTIQNAVFSAVELARQQGERLEKARELCLKEGIPWLQWLKDNVSFSRQSADAYLKVHRNWALLPADGNFSLRECLKLLAGQGTVRVQGNSPPAPAEPPGPRVITVRTQGVEPAPQSEPVRLEVRRPEPAEDGIPARHTKEFFNQATEEEAQAAADESAREIVAGVLGKVLGTLGDVERWFAGKTEEYLADSLKAGLPGTDPSLTAERIDVAITTLIHVRNAITFCGKKKQAAKKRKKKPAGRRKPAPPEGRPRHRGKKKGGGR